ncbi:hypothetical protein Q7P37_007739 [Cladosporium fusiforme]
MECAWDSILLQRLHELPDELIEAISIENRNGDYLSIFTQTSIDPRYTYTLLAYAPDLFAHIAADLRRHASLPDAIATLGRVVPFAPHLTPFAQRLLESEQHLFESSNDSSEDVSYLLGLFRLLRHDHRAFSYLVDPSVISRLLQRSERPVVYLAIRILQIILNGADQWFEEMVGRYLGGDNPETPIDGIWDGKSIDFRFLTLWEEERHERVLQLVQDVQKLSQQQQGTPSRVIPASCFHSSCSLIGGVLLPNFGASSETQHLSQLVETPTVAQNVRSTASALKSTSPLLLTGLAGSGKTLIIRDLAARLGKLDQMVTLHLNEQSDAKLLVGVYATGDSPGSFVWKAGVLTTAVQEGRWVCIEDLDRAPQEIIGALLPLIERGELTIPSRKQVIHAKQGFRIIATARSTLNHRGEQTKPLTHMLGRRHWHEVQVAMPSTAEQRDIALHLYPSIEPFLPQFITVFDRLQSMRQGAVLVGQSKTGVLRPISPRDLLKWCSRVTHLLQGRKSFSGSDLDGIFLEAVDCFVGALPDGEAKTSIASVIAEELRIDPERRAFLLTQRDTKYESEKTRITVGRYSLPRSSSARKAAQGQSTFSTNPHTSRMLERVAAAVLNKEPLLLVGETGVGKTTAVQHLATHLDKKLVPFNLSQQSEAGDLLGGFKPVNARSLMVPLKDEFDEMFSASFSQTRNQQFLDLLGKQMVKSNWKAVCKLWHQALKMVDQQRPSEDERSGEAPSKKRKIEKKKPDFAKWDAFAEKVGDMEHRLAAGNDGFAFSFIEGNIVKAARNGDWILLDEINLASSDTLEALADLLDPTAPSILLTEAGNIERIDASPDFRVFAAMNPATDVGKKDLPPGIRSRFTELYVDSPDKDLKSLQSIVRAYLRTEAAADPAIALDVSKLYQRIIELSLDNKLVDGAGQQPHFSLRTLTRTLSYARCIASMCSLRRALYEGMQMSFMTFLDAESSKLVQPLLEQHLFAKLKNTQSELRKALRKPEDGHGYVQGYPGSKHWVRQGREELQDQPHYIITPFIRNNLENLVRASSTRQFPVLIQGPTSSGKTSMIEYLAGRTGHKFVRINNHEHTDLQEYLGTYVSGADGKLQFQEGVLVKALREGHWIVLDELNLAPTDVLEALNRLLDDNRELLIPETQEVIRPHSDFMLFATQNPAGLYGGRKTLSRAFRNRFLELHFDDIPIDELQEILHKRTQLPESRAKRIVSVYRELSVLRQENRLFEQKSFATLRDLFRWALRTNDTIEQLAANGFMLLAERVRKPEERDAVKAVIEKVMSTRGPKVTIDEAALYSNENPEIQHHVQHAKHQGAVWTNAMRRLYALVSRAVSNNEPVLLVGETGCGKTTVFQMLADALKQDLHIVNAHQNTETGDLIGSQRPVRNRAALEAQLRENLLAMQFLDNLDMGAAQSTEGLLDMYGRYLQSLSSSERQQFEATEAYENIQSSCARYKALFEWADGSLVEAMKTGAFFLLDEISLADDSVLERINSVLEPSRSILLAEKGSLDSFVTAEPGFKFFATMNPGGDYGKRELSPALRNRFTEIWVPALSDLEDVAQIVRGKLVPAVQAYSSSMVSFAHWFKEQYNTSASSAVSIRDVLAWSEFVNAFSSTDAVAGVVHGAAMVYIDTLGANPAGLMTMTGKDLEAERRACLSELTKLLGADSAAVYDADITVAADDKQATFGPFAVTRKSSAPVTHTFNFDAPTTRANAMRVVRAMQLVKPVMLEGSPGVGKTALVTAISAVAGVPLTRINLSEQTDLMDLFGSDTPVQGAEAGTFAWRDAPFLRAMKNGEWVLLDEMNLASQSVLEGLNACLDHRGEVFIPEIGQTFARHPDFRLFAAQNPHHQGGGRKGLPASFVNRFTVVYADSFRSEDLVMICQRIFPTLEKQTIQQAVQFVDTLDVEIVHHRRFGAQGGPWEFNLRDTTRWLSLIQGSGLLTAGNPRDFVDLLFTQRFRNATDRSHVARVFASVYGSDMPTSDMFSSVSKTTLQLGLGVVPRDPLVAPTPKKQGSTDIVSHHLQALQSLMVAVQCNWPVILSGPSGSGKTALVEGLAATIGSSVETFAMNAETDAMDLVGGYEQADPLRQTLQMLDDFCTELDNTSKTAITNDPSHGHVALAAELRRSKADAAVDVSSLATVAQLLKDHSSLPGASDLVAALEQSAMPMDKARFVWIDGILVDALEQGKWLVLDNANLCSPSVLDRLNSLLEPNGSLIINEHVAEDGTPRTIRPHPNFRIFMTVDSRYGELSRPMRNRALEIHLLEDESVRPNLSPLQPESAVARFRQCKSLGTITDLPASLLHDHLGLGDLPLVSRFTTQLTSGLYRGFATDSELQVAQHDNAPKFGKAREQLAAFYELAVGQKQVSADFARVQTVHPLNNQPLIQQSEEVFSRALSLGFMHELHQEIYSLAVAVQALQSDRATVAKLVRVERTSASKRDGAVSATLQSVSNVVRAVIGQSEQFELSASTMASLKIFFRWLTGSLQHLIDVSVRQDLNQALLNASFSVARDICAHNSATEIKDTPLLKEIGHHMNAVTRQDTSGWGSAMVPLWQALKPNTPPTTSDLEDLLRLEDIVAQFDRASERFQQPVETIAGLRLSFARALARAKAGGADVDQLAEKLKSIIPAATNDEQPADGESGEPVEPVEPTQVNPHFTVVFRELIRHFDLLRLSGRSLEATEQAALHVFAMQPTSNFVCNAENGQAPSCQWMFDLLRAVAQPTATRNGQAKPLSEELLYHLRTRGTVSIGRFFLLESEMATLGKTLASQTHLITQSVLPSLNDGLRQLITKVLTTLSEHSRNDHIREASQWLASLLHSADLQGLKQTLASGKLPVELQGFASSILLVLNASDASQAWLNFTTSCLRLYLPAVQFDPALEPILKRQVFDRVASDLESKLSTLRGYKLALTGEQSSLRLRLLEQDRLALGSAPEAPQICRPQVSELAELQMDFDNLRRILTTIESDKKMVLDAGLQANVQQIRRRLSDHYRSYEDLTAPVVGLLACLDVCRDLAHQEAALEVQPEQGSKLQSIVPFFNSSLANWSSDAILNKALPAAASQQETLLWLATVSARSCAWPLADADSSLKQRIEQQFARLYDQWRTELGRDQREEAAKSSLYRYSGEDEMIDDPTDEELGELFPDADNESKSSKKLSGTQGEATRIASLHRGIFTGGNLDPDTVVALLDDFAKVSSTAGVGSNVSVAIPMLLLQMQDPAPKQHSNIYKDANLDQVRKLFALLGKVQDRFNELHQSWPEHATPMEVLAICDQILAMEHSEPLVRFLPTIEKLHATINEWQKVASREYTAVGNLEALTDLIVSWRQLELSSWAGLFDEETRQVQANAASWWFIAYETIIAATEGLPNSQETIQQHVVGLLKALEDFFHNSGFGEYHTRLDLLRNFERHLAARSRESAAFTAVRQALANFISYFSHYEAPVQESLATGRTDLEKKIKEVIQLASWKDRNIETLRQSAKTSHRKLFRLVKKFRVLLAKPVAQVLAAGIQSLPKEQSNPAPSTQPSFAPLEVGQENVLASLQSWAARPARFRNVSVTADLITSKCQPISWPQEAAQRLTEFLEDVQESITELQKATPKQLKEENKKLVSHLKTRKRRLLADVLKKIRAMGFQHNLSQDLLDSQSTLSRALHKLGALEHDNERPAQKASQSHLHKLLGLMPSVREGSRKHSDDLTAAEAARCAVYLESVLAMSTTQQNKLCQYSKDSIKLRSSLEEFQAFAACIQPATNESVQGAFSLQKLRCMPTVLETCARLIRLQSQLASRNYQPAIDGLSQLATDAQVFVNQMNRTEVLPAGIIKSENLEQWQNTINACEKATADIANWVEAYPELEPTLIQMTKWLPSRIELQQASIHDVDTVSDEQWTSSVFEFADKLLVAVQRLEKALPSEQPDDNEAAWLLRDEHQLEAAWEALDTKQAAMHTNELLSKLHSASKQDPTTLSALSAVCKSIFPLLHAYSAASEQVLTSYTNLHLRVNQMGHLLGTSFVTLARDGFCSPPEKSEDSKQDSGDVEAGTGLGDGEGGEDISKDIGNEEDLSELAQENKGKDREEDIEDEQDAVDMADQEMEGDLGDAETGSQKDEEEGDDQSEGDDLEEEEGKVGDLDDGAVDEKMWDDGKKDEQQDDKEKEDGKGTAQDQEMSAANEGEKEEGEDGEAGEDGEMEEEDQAAGPDEEEVSKKDTEAADPHMQEQENLDLPDDLNMDGDGDDKDDMSDAGSMEEDDMPPDTGAEDEPAGEADKDEGDEPEEAAQPESEEKEGEADEDQMQTQEAGEDAEAQDDPEVSDDEDENLLQNKDTEIDDAPEEGTTEGDQGASKDEDEPQAQAAGGANADDKDTEPNEDAQAKQDSGTQSGANETEAEQPSEKSEQSAAAQSQSNYKQIGDVLEEWYKQQREIEAPTESAEADNQEQQDIDMANATFEHLPDAEAQADTQALGTASADQSGALNEETSKAVNEDKEMEDAPFQEMPEDDAGEEEPHDNTGDQDGQMDPSDQLPPTSDAKAFVGEQNNAQDDIEMGDDGQPKEIDADDNDGDVEDMDDQLLHTHISREDGPEEMTIEEARQTWAAHEASTRNLSLILTEHLRLILQPTQATKMRGDFRTGKRLNIKRIIPYIASSYKRDKIWMRRSIPSKRNYQIMLAIDDSKSMDESDSKSLAYETLALVAKSMSMLEVGELSVLGFGENVKVAHDFSTPFTSEAGAEVFKSFSFAQSKTNVQKLLEESIALFQAARLKAVGSSELWQLQLIISDGVCEDHPKIRQLVRQAHEERIMIVFVVVDSAAQKTDASGSGNSNGAASKPQSIVDLQRAEFVKDANGESQLNMVKYLDTFPFRYYLIVRDVQELPGVLAGALRQWFAEVVDSGA